MSTDVLSTDLILERLARDGVRKTVAALRKPPVPSRLLQELADRDDPATARQFVAAYPLSPSHLLEALAQTAHDPEVFTYLAVNPRTPPHLLSGFATHDNPDVRAQVATHPQLAARELLTLAADGQTEVRRAVATNPALRLPHHAALVADAQPSVRLRLATQSGLPPQVALVLAADASTVVRTHTIASTPVDDELLLGWAASDEEDVQLALTARKDLPAPVRMTLLLSPSASVRRVARTLIEPDPIALLHFVQSGDAEERAWVAGRTPLASPLQRLLARDETPSVRLALAANPSLVAEIVDFFIGSADEAVCCALATNPALSGDQVQALAATRIPAILTALAYRDDLDPELVVFLLGHSADFLRHWAIQKKDTPLHDPALARQLVADPLPTVRALAVRHHPWRRADLYDFARDRAAVVRLAALRHAHASDELVSDLRKDPVAEIAQAAMELHAAREKAARSAPPKPSPAPAPTAPARPAPISELAPRSTGASTPAPAPRPTVPAPKLFDQLKRLFWK